MKPTVKSVEINGMVFEFPDYAELLDSKLDKSELSNAITVALGEAWLSGRFKGKLGEKGEQGVAGKDGKDGANGISATHSWNGTTLTITSASGTSSANLKGEQGERGLQGEQGIQGIQGEKGADGAKGEKGDKGDTQKVLLSYNKDMKRLSISEVLLDAKNLDTKRY